MIKWYTKHSSQNEFKIILRKKGMVTIPAEILPNSFKVNEHCNLGYGTDTTEIIIQPHPNGLYALNRKDKDSPCRVSIGGLCKINKVDLTIDVPLKYRIGIINNIECIFIQTDYNRE